MQSETGFPSSHQLKSYVASKSRLKLAARAVLSADAGLLVLLGPDCHAPHLWHALKLLMDTNLCFIGLHSHKCETTATEFGI